MHMFNSRLCCGQVGINATRGQVLTPILNKLTCMDKLASVLLPVDNTFAAVAISHQLAELSKKKLNFCLSSCEGKMGILPDS